VREWLALALATFFPCGKPDFGDSEQILSELAPSSKEGALQPFHGFGSRLLEPFALRHCATSAGAFFLHHAMEGAKNPLNQVPNDRRPKSHCSKTAYALPLPRASHCLLT